MELSPAVALDRPVHQGVGGQIGDAPHLLLVERDLDHRGVAGKLVEVLEDIQQIGEVHRRRAPLTGLDPALRGPQSLRSRLIPRAADERPVLDCQFAGDLLDCILTTPGEPDTIEFHFARKPEAT